MQPARSLAAIVTDQEVWQGQEVWHFDLRSALIGALLAWILVAALYSQREMLRRTINSIWEPFVSWRRRAQASNEEKYARALRQTLGQVLLLRPKSPELVLQVCDFLVPAPLPSSIGEAAQSPRLLTVPYAGLLTGHNKVVITGSLGSGRTSTLLLSVWRMTGSQPTDDPRQPQKRLPFWIDAAAFARAWALKRENAEAHAPAQRAAEEQIATLAAATVAGWQQKWVLTQLRKESCLVVIDNWESLLPDDRRQLAQWISEAEAQFQDVFWLVASSDEGYGHLVEKGFVPAQVLPATSNVDLEALVMAWSDMLGISLETRSEEALPEEALSEGTPEDPLLEALEKAVRSYSPLWEIHLRIVLYLRTGELPERPVEVLGRMIETNLAASDLGKGQEEIAEPARDLALRVIVAIAAAYRLEGKGTTTQQARELIESLLPPKEERPRRLEGAVRQLVDQCGIVVEDGKQWIPIHQVWGDYLTALHLALDDQGQEMVHTHVNDPTWFMLSEFYAGLADVGKTVTTLVNQAELNSDPESLLRATRWGIIAEPDSAWRQDLNRAIAQTFMSEELDYDTRLRIAQALNLVAGEGARAFFLRMLRHTNLEVQCAALRGLGRASSSRDMPILGAALRGSEENLQETAVLALRDMNTPGATAFLTESLPQASESLMLVIAQALALMPDGGQSLDDASQHPDIMVRRAAAQGLGLITEEWAHERLLEMMREDPQWLVRSAADMALQMNEERADLQVSIPAPPQVDAMDWLIAWAARQGLGLGVGAAALETLGRATQEGNIDAKILSTLTLAQIGRQSDLKLLEPLLAEPDPDVQQAANWAIQRIHKRYHIYQEDYIPA